MRVRAVGQYLSIGVLCSLLCTSALAGLRETAERDSEQLTQQARQLWEAGRYQQVLPLAQRALSIREKALGPEHPLTVRSLNNLANVCSKTGAYEQAEQLYRRILAIREKTLPPEHADIAAALNNLAITYAALGESARAEPLQQRALALREKLFGPQHVETAKSLNNLALLYIDNGDYARAEPLCLRTLAIREQALGPDHLDTGAALSNLGTVYYFTGAYAQAETASLRALAIYEKALPPQHPELAGPLNNLGEIYVAMGTHARALDMYQRALSIREAALGAQHPDVAGSLNNLGGLQRAMGQTERAEPLYQRALAIVEQRLGPQHPDTAKALNNLANLYLDIGEHAKAEPLYTRALAIRKQLLGPNHPDVAQSLGNLALLAWARGQAPRALTLFQQGHAIRAQQAEQFLYSGSEARQRAYLQALSEDTFVAVAFSIAKADRAGTELGLSSVLQYKGRALDTHSDNIARLRRSMSPQDRVLLDRLARIANQSSSALYRGVDQTAAGSRSRQLDELTQQRDSLEAQLARRSSEFRQQAQPVTLARIRQALPAEGVLVEWIRYKPFDPTAASIKTQWAAPRYAAYVLPPLGAPTVIDLGDAATLEQLAGEFNRAVSDAKRSDVRTHAAALSDKLIAPLMPQLRAHPRWLLSPDGALNLVPMAALLDAEGHYLAERYEITYLSSGRDLLRIANDTPPSSMQAVVVADPDYGGSTMPTLVSYMQTAESTPGGDLTFRPLPGTALEAQSLQAMFGAGGATIFTREQASEAQLRSLHGPRLLHIATHGFFLEDRTTGSESGGALAPAERNPLLRAGLALAGANLRRAGRGDDGILTALEMAQLDLRGTQLVVLSACETALGEAASGEGIDGLRRALVLAGAESQITSLWQISDQATRQLMERFYRRLLQGAGRSAALRAAQRDMMVDPVRWHPYHWAGFVPAGNWRPLTRPR